MVPTIPKIYGLKKIFIFQLLMFVLMRWVCPVMGLTKNRECRNGRLKPKFN